jgi:hypothetical protein
MMENSLAVEHERFDTEENMLGSTDTEDEVQGSTIESNEPRVG